MLAKRANRLVEMNFFLVERNVELCLQLVSNHTRGDSAKHLAVLTGLDGQDTNQFGDALAQLRHRIEFVGFAFGATLFERLETSLIGSGQGDCQPLWEQVIARIPRGDSYLV